ncbi:hypothetical protein KAW38_00300 [Candidatus Micrarchaeota archaeon]|nr:hypothetical protein [Candidatus Micrarchaeota archaeon]
MAIGICQRCGEQTAKLEKCDYCDRLICNMCKKSAKIVGKLKRLVICKDCWGNMKRRGKFKKE